MMRLSLALAVGFIAATTLGLSAAHAQDAQPPATTGPQYLVSVGEDGLIIVAGGTRTKTGNMASVTVTSGSNPATLAETGFARLDMTYQFNCSNRTYITPVFAVYGPNNDLVGALTDDSPWEAVNPGAPSEVILAFACDGTVPPHGELDGSPNDIVTSYREWVATL